MRAILKHFGKRELRCFMAWDRDGNEVAWDSPGAKFVCGAGVYSRAKTVHFYSELNGEIRKLRARPAYGPVGSPK